MTNQEKIFELVLAERQRQTEKFGKQVLPPFKWLLILQEEIGELSKAMFESEPLINQQTEALQTLSVLVQMGERYAETNRGLRETAIDVLTRECYKQKGKGILNLETSFTMLITSVGDFAQNAHYGDWKFGDRHHLTDMICSAYDVLYNLLFRATDGN